MHKYNFKCNLSGFYNSSFGRFPYKKSTFLHNCFLKKAQKSGNFRKHLESHLIYKHTFQKNVPVFTLLLSFATNAVKEK